MGTEINGCPQNTERKAVWAVSYSWDVISPWKTRLWWLQASRKDVTLTLELDYPKTHGCVLRIVKVREVSGYREALYGFGDSGCLPQSVTKNIYPRKMKTQSYWKGHESCSFILPIRIASILSRKPESCAEMEGTCAFNMELSHLLLAYTKHSDRRFSDCHDWVPFSHSLLSSPL